MKTLFPCLLSAAALLSSFASFAADDEAAEAAEAQKSAAALAAPIKAAKVTLQAGIKASEKEGKPISAKFEVEDGKLQLSVYTAKGDKFSEVVVDHLTGKVARAEAITSGDDLEHAKSQAAAMAKSKQ